MPAYVMANVDITDPVAFADYLKAGPATVAAHGGTCLARGSAVELPEGDRVPTPLTILEFDGIAHAKAWYESPEYRPLPAIRNKAAKSKMVVIEGV